MVASGWVSGGGLVVVDGASEWLWVEGREKIEMERWRQRWADET